MHFDIWQVPILSSSRATLQVHTSEKAMRSTPLPPEVMPGLVEAANEVISRLDGGLSSLKSERAAVKVEQPAASFDSLTAAQMAAGWCRTFGAGPRFGSTAEYSICGLAAAVLLCSVPR